MYCYIRSTCMPNPCRQRSSWARIKLSIKIIWTTEVVARFLRRIDLARFLCVIWNYIQIQCKLSGYIALFNFQTTFSFIADRLSTSLHHLANRSVIFNLAQVWHLSNFIFNFFQTFLFQLQPLACQRFAAWGLLYHSFEVCQTYLQSFFKFFFNSAFRKLQ